MPTLAYEVIGTFLRHFFRYNRYLEAVRLARLAIAEDPQERENWHRIAQAIRDRELEVGEPIRLFVDCANLPLDEDTDEEAYLFLDKMVANLESEGSIDEY